eukprot:1138628-Pelagomonas_calceolata.AAC.3
MAAAVAAPFGGGGGSGAAAAVPDVAAAAAAADPAPLPAYLALDCSATILQGCDCSCYRWGSLDA